MSLLVAYDATVQTRKFASTISEEAALTSKQPFPVVTKTVSGDLSLN